MPISSLHILFLKRWVLKKQDHKEKLGTENFFWKKRPQFFGKWIALIVLFIICFFPEMVLAADVEHVLENVDRLWVLLAAGLVYLMQAGFMSFEVGSVRHKNTTAMAMKNAIDWVACSLAFFICGFSIMYGHTVGGFLGGDLFQFSRLINSPDGIPLRWVFFMFQVGFAGTAITIVSGAMAERTGFITYLCGSFFMGLIIYPVFGHWAWGNLFIESNQPWLARLGFMDFAGSTVVHSVGAWVALVGVWMLGPRLGRYDQKGNLIPLPGSSIPWSIMGVFILWFGWWGFNGGSTLAMGHESGSIIFNTNLSAAAAGLAAFFHAYFFQGKADLKEKFMGGLLGGLVAITACCNVMSPLGSLFVGLTAGVIHNLGFDLIIKKLRLDDPVGAIPVHGICGVWGTLCVALWGRADQLAHPRLHQLAVQGVGIVVCFLWTVVMAFIMFKFLKATVGLRVSPEEEKEGLSLDHTFRSVSENLDEEDLKKLIG